VDIEVHRGQEPAIDGEGGVGRALVAVIPVGGRAVGAAAVQALRGRAARFPSAHLP
ncbi:hypothetical protein N325_00081, partial [Colius striatus]